jgi:hypothetical protein
VLYSLYVAVIVVTTLRDNHKNYLIRNNQTI